MIVWPLVVATLLTVGFAIYLVWLPKPPTKGKK